MRVCWPAGRCTFDTQWDVFSKQQEMADADGAQLPLLSPDHTMLLCVCVCVCADTCPSLWHPAWGCAHSRAQLKRVEEIMKGWNLRHKWEFL